MKGRAALRVIRGPQLATVGGDDGAADRKAQPQPLGFRREKGLEDTPHYFGRNTVAQAGDRYPHVFAIHQVGADEEPALNALDASHRVAAVDYEIEQNLLKLHSVAIDRRQMRRKLGMDGYFPIHQIATHQLKDAFYYSVQVYGLKLHLAFF